MTERDSSMVEGANDGEAFDVLVDDDDSETLLSINVCLICSRFASNLAIRLVPSKYSRNFCNTYGEQPAKRIIIVEYYNKCYTIDKN